jgi:hypothetical protein
MKRFKKQKKRPPNESPLLQSREPEDVEGSSLLRLESPRQSQQDLPSGLGHHDNDIVEAQPTPHQRPADPGTSREDSLPADLLDPALIGRVIKLVRAPNWEEDLTPTIKEDTQILYENQRG